ncbi:MAG: sulfatase [Propionibacteriales bacterium]|nr:sulfatase [Propionibacteriales bacterium]
MASLLTAPQGIASPLPPENHAAIGGQRPDIVLITTDDQTLRDLRHMPVTRRLLQAKGVTFTGLSPHPLCCPARAEILTGQYAQNNGVYSNTGAHGGYQHFRPGSTVATWLHRAGYQTAFMGKFLNGYGRSDIHDPTPGWDEWHPTVAGVYNYTDFTINHNGRLRSYHDSYQTDVYAQLGARTVRDFAQDSSPFFMWQSFVAPHGSCGATAELHCWGPPVPAKRHQGLFATEVPPAFSDPSYDEADVRDKPSWLQNRPRISPTVRHRLVRLHRMRLRALQSVDEGVRHLVRALAHTGRLDNTLIIFTSDNGYLFGEHRLNGKNYPYEPALKVPFLMRGPGLPVGVTAPNVAASLDIAATIAAAAHADPTLRVDGRNLLPLVTGPSRGRDTVLIQAGTQFDNPAAPSWRFRGVRTQRYTFVRYPQTNEHELYDRRTDPAQQRNVSADPRYFETRRELGRRLGALKDCSGAVCRQHFGAVPLPLLR